MPIFSRNAFAATLLALALPSTGAMASTVDVVQQFANPGKGTSIVGRMSMPRSDGTQKTGTYRAGALLMQGRATGTASPFEDFVAYCVEVTTDLATNRSTPVTYTGQSSLFGTAREQLIATLFAEAYDPNASAKAHGAFQLALWNLVYGDISDTTGSGFDIAARDSDGFTAGHLDFDKASDNTQLRGRFEDRTPGVFALAQGWLDALNQDGGTEDWTLRTGASGLTFLTSANSQDLVTYTPPQPPGPGPAPVIPLPAGFFTLGAALVGLVGHARLKSRRRG